MGCASSTPMIATAGGEMLKAATNVADDVTKSAEEAVQGATQAVGKTVDQAKASVGTAVTGIAHELETVYVEKTEALDEAKNQLLQKLHLGGAATTTNGQKEASGSDAAAGGGGGSNSRAPSPTGQGGDTDSLKTSTPEPEIEQALAKFNEEKPPTPNPTLAELEQLSGDHSAAVGRPAEGPGERLLRRPNTTEWEQYADQLSRTQKSHPHEVYRRSVAARVRGGGAAGRGAPGAALTTTTATTTTAAMPLSITAAEARRIAQQVVNPLAATVPLDGLPPPPSPLARTIAAAAGVSRNLLEDDSGWSDPYYNNNNNSSSPTDASWPRGMRRPFMLPRPFGKRYQRDFAARLGRGGRGVPGRGRGYLAGSKRGADYGYRERNGNFIGYEGDFDEVDNFYSGDYDGYGLGGFGLKGSTVPLGALGRYQRGTGIGQSPHSFGRRFDYNPLRNRLESPPNKARSLTHLGRSPRPTRRLPRLGGDRGVSPGRGHTVFGRAGHSSPIRTRALIQNRVRTGSELELSSHTDDASSVELSRSLPPPQMGVMSPLSRSSRSSTNKSIAAVRSARTTPQPLRSLTPGVSPLPNGLQPPPSVDPTTNKGINNAATPTAIKNDRVHQPTKQRTMLDLSYPDRARSLSRTSSPFSHTSNLELHPRVGAASPSPLFLDKLRSVSSFDMRPPMRHDYGGDKENNKAAAFVADLSSVSGNRTPVSPYKLRDRCAVCHKKYVIK